MSHDSVIQELGAICPMTMLRARRIMLFAKATKVDATKVIMLEVCNVPGTWSCDILGDLMWLSVFPQFSECGSLDLKGWMEHVLCDYGLFRRRVKAVCQLPVANRVTQ